MFNSKFNKFVSLFLSLVFSFSFLSADVISIKGYAETDFNIIAHNQNLEEANDEGEEERLIQGNGSQLPSTVLVGKTDFISLDNNRQNPYLLNTDNNWWLLRNYDHLDYNTIHIMVQKDIVEQNPGVKKELYFKYNYPDSNYPNGKKTGSADLYYENLPYYYLWEVKPKSYLDVNRDKGENQLNEYINRNKLQVGKETKSNMINTMSFRRGETKGVSIENGNLYFFVYVVTPKCDEGYVEEIRYDVHYEAQSNGFLFWENRTRTCRGTAPNAAKY